MMKSYLRICLLSAIPLLIILESFGPKDKDPKTPKTQITSIASGFLNNVTDLKKGPDGELYVLNGNMILKIVNNEITDTLSIPEAVIAEHERNHSDEPFIPVCFEIDNRGIIYLSDGIHSIKKIEMDGSFTSMYAKQFQSSKEPLYGADAMAINPIDHSIYFTNNVNPVVYKITGEGEIVRAIDLSYEEGAMSLAIAPDGNIWTGTWNRISKAPKNGNIAHYGFRSMAPYYGEGPLTDIRIEDFVSGITITKDGSTLYMVNEGQIKKVFRGKVTILAEDINAGKIALSKNEDAIYFTEDGELKQLLLIN